MLKKNTMLQIPRLDKSPKGNRIAFFSPMCSGKTFCADYLVTYKGFTKFSFAGKLKALAYELYGVEGKDGHNRVLLHDLGDSLRAFDEDVFTKYTLLQMHKNEATRLVVDDLRLPREAQLLRTNGFKIIEVLCSEEIRLGRVQTLYPSVPDGLESHSTESSFGQIRKDDVVSSVTAAQTMDELDNLLEKYWTSR